MMEGDLETQSEILSLGGWWVLFGFLQLVLALAVSDFEVAISSLSFPGTCPLDTCLSQEFCHESQKCNYQVSPLDQALWLAMRTQSRYNSSLIGI